MLGSQICPAELGHPPLRPREVAAGKHPAEGSNTTVCIPVDIVEPKDSEDDSPLMLIGERRLYGVLLATMTDMQMVEYQHWSFQQTKDHCQEAGRRL